MRKEEGSTSRRSGDIIWSAVVGEVKGEKSTFWHVERIINIKRRVREMHTTKCKKSAVGM